MLAVCAALACAAFLALGSWQVQRLDWKLDLIERVERRVHAPAVPAPGRAQWPQVSAAADEYRRVRVEGVFLHHLSARVQAVTELGSGFWLLTPLRASDGSVVLVNRGFIAPGPVAAGFDGAASGTTAVTGLLRISEPGGGFLRDNDPAANRWYSRDVQAIAAARGLSGVAPYFIDAGAAGQAGAGRAAGQPVGGLTVIFFHNNHLIYALTWYALALMAGAGALWVAREERRGRPGDER